MIITDLNLSALRYFVDSIELGSLTEAAHKNSVSRPAVSKAIRRIEEVVGYELISHEKNVLLLTDEGRIFLQKAKTCLELLSQTLSDEFKDSRKIDLACSNTLAEFMVLPALKKLKTIPDVKLQIGTTSKVRQSIIEGTAKIGLVIDDGLTFGLQVQDISEGKFVLCSKSGNFESPLITTEPRAEVISLLKMLKRKNKIVSQSLQFESWTICRKSAEVIGGSCLIPELVSGHGLRPVKDLKFEHHYRIQAIYKDSNLLSEAELRFLRALPK